MSKTAPDSMIEVYPDMSDLQEPQLRVLTKFERTIFGGSDELGDFGEYAACTDVQCRSIKSIQEVHPDFDAAGDVSLEELEARDEFELPSCDVCEKDMTLIFNPEVFWRFLKDYFKHREIVHQQAEVISKVAGAIMLDKNSTIMGSTVAYPTTMVDIVGENINYRNSYDVPAVMNKLAEIMGLNSGAEAEQILGICWNRIAFRKDAAGKGKFPKLVGSLFNLLSKYDDLPVVVDTRPDSRLYPLLKAIGFIDVMHDEHGWAIICLQTQAQLREAVNMDAATFKEKHGEALRFERRQRELYIQHKKEQDASFAQEHGHPPRRHFRGAALIDDFY